MPARVTPSRTLKLPAADRPVIQSSEWELQAIHEVTNPPDPQAPTGHWVSVAVSADVDPGTYGLVRARCIETGDTTGTAVVHSSLQGVLLGWLASSTVARTTIHVEAIRTLTQRPGGGVRVSISAAIGADVFVFDPQGVAYPIGYDPSSPPPWPAVGSGTGGVLEAAVLDPPLPPSEPFSITSTATAQTIYGALVGLSPISGPALPVAARAELVLGARKVPAT